MCCWPTGIGPKVHLVHLQLGVRAGGGRRYARTPSPSACIARNVRSYVPHMTASTAPEMLKVGDLARTAGLTVRALHHYESIGLLNPSAHTSGGHRLYGPDAVTRLYRITRLRQLSLSLDQIRSALDDPQWGLLGEIRQHLEALDAQLNALSALRTNVAAALASVAANDDPTSTLLEVLTTMEEIHSSVRRRISILVYQDVEAAHHHLVNVFGLTPGDVTHGPDGTVVHAEVFAGDGAIWLHPESPPHQLLSPARLGGATATTAVMVRNVDEHYALVVDRGGRIDYPPTDQPYGYREYGARDLEGSLWSFMEETDQ